MRILMLSWRGPTHPRAGGAEEYTQQILAGLAERGHAVTWYSARHDGPLPKQWRGVQMVYGAPGLAVYAAGHAWSRQKSGAFDVVVDQINTFGFMTPSPKRRVVALIHQVAEDVWDAECPVGVRHVGRFLERRVLARYRQTPFVTVGEGTMADIRRIGWRGAGWIVPNAIDLPPLTPKAERPTLCFLGRLNARSKRLDHAVAIFERVRADLPQAELWVIGRGAPPPGLLDRVGVRRFSNVSSIERDRLLGAAWVCLATSVREGWGRMVLEAAAAGTPSVVYDAPGLREAVAAGVTGEVVPVDVGRAAECVARLLRDPSRVRSLGDQARARAAGLDWGGSVARFEEVLEIVRSGGGWSDRKMPINEEVMAS